MINSFIIEKNNFLNQNIIAYYHQVYTGYGNPGNPNFINTLSETNASFSKTIISFFIKISFI